MAFGIMPFKTRVLQIESIYLTMPDLNSNPPSYLCGIQHPIGLFGKRV